MLQLVLIFFHKLESASLVHIAQVSHARLDAYSAAITHAPTLEAQIHVTRHSTRQNRHMPFIKADVTYCPIINNSLPH